jgi:hypothetical protein
VAIYVELMFLHLVGSADRVVHPVHPGYQTSIHSFSCLGRTGSDSTKSAPRKVMPNFYVSIRWDL